jgi:hypothetical protein
MVAGLGSGSHTEVGARSDALRTGFLIPPLFCGKLCASINDRSQFMSAKIERSVIRSLAQLVGNEAALLNRWRITGRVFGITGWALLFYSAFKYFEQPLVHHGLIPLAMLGGVGASLGMWFSSFAVQWPVVAQFIDRQAIAARANEL